MPQIEKIIRKMQEQPHGIRLAEAERVLFYYGYRLARKKGSHRHYINENGDVITLKNPLKAAYVIEILARIDRKKG